MHREADDIIDVAETSTVGILCNHIINIDLRMFVVIMRHPVCVSHGITET